MPEAAQARRAAPDPWRNRIIGHVELDPLKIAAHPRNWRAHPDAQRERLRGAIHEIGIIDEVKLNQRTGFLVDGHLRVALAIQEKQPSIPVTLLDLDPKEELLALAIYDPLGEMAETNGAILETILAEAEAQDEALQGFLSELWERAHAGFDQGGEEEEEEEGEEGEEEKPSSAGALAAAFVVPPFSVLDARQGYWQARKSYWLALGIASQEGRELLGGRGAHTGKNSAFNRLSGKLARDILDTSPVTSIFDPVLTELAYRWFCPPSGRILDPFAGGSVRGIVAALLGRSYVGIDLRPEQVEINRRQWEGLAERLSASSAEELPFSDEPEEPEEPELEEESEKAALEAAALEPGLTPVYRHGGYWVKRDDLYSVAGASGGKARTAWALASREPRAPGLVSAGARHSPQAVIVARVARALGLGCRIHMPKGERTPEMRLAEEAGAELVLHPAGYNTVIVARAREDARASGWREIPFGMECAEAVIQTAAQAANLPAEARRVVIPVGSAMSLAGLLRGLREQGRALPVLGVVVGADPEKRLDAYAPGWRDQVELVRSGSPYEEPAALCRLGDLELDPHYEAKCLPWLREGDLLWVVGKRPDPREAQAEASLARERSCAAPASSYPPPVWLEGDGLDCRELAGPLAEGGYDLVFTCPPYGDLEIYSSDPRDLSQLALGDYQAFRLAYREIVRRSLELLAPDRFAAVVVGDFRDDSSAYRNFVSETISAFEEGGARLYNEAILVTALGSLPLRTSRNFVLARKLAKTHQNVLVFVKGDWRRAVEACGKIAVELPAELRAELEEANRLAEESYLDEALSEEEAIDEGLEPEPLRLPGARWKLSAKWAAHRVACTPEGIKACRGKCCWAPSLWPALSGSGSGCPHLGPAGCRLSAEDKPILCHIYPFTLNKADTLIIAQHAFFGVASCKPCKDQGPTALEAILPSLALLFGERQAGAAAAAVAKGQDYTFEVPPAVLAAYRRELEWERARAAPRPRSEEG